MSSHAVGGKRRAARSPRDFQLAWICALHHELAASQAMLDEEYELDWQDPSNNDNNVYVAGRIGGQDIIMVCLPAGSYGIDSATSTVKDMVRSFPSIKAGLLVGIGGGVPGDDPDVRLGDVVVGLPSHAHAGVVQYDLEKILPNGQFQRKRHLNKPPKMLLNAVQSLRSHQERHGAGNVLQHIDQALQHNHLPQSYKAPETELDLILSEGRTIERKPRVTACGSTGTQPLIHYGLIATGSKVIASALERDRLRQSDPEIICFEMEAGGIVDELPCLVVRGISDYADADKREDWQRYAASCAAAYTKELVHLLRTHASQAMESLSDQSTYKAVIEGLSFSQQDLRESQISVAHGGTCDWLFDSKEPSPGFTKWIENGRGLFWISGKPGSGKSTLMKKLGQSETLKRHLSKWTSSRHLVFVRHFFFRPGSDLQSNISGFLRHILYQILSDGPHIFQLFKHLPDPPQKAQLIELVLHILSTQTLKMFFLIVDGIDEFTGSEEDQDDLLQLMQALAKRSNVKICLSGRPEYVYQDAFKSFAYIRVQDHTFEDFRTVVFSTLQGPYNRYEPYLQRDFQAASDLICDICSKADGVFLWLHLALKELVRGVKRNDSVEVLQQRLGLMKNSLDGLFEDLLSRLDNVYKSRAANLLGSYAHTTIIRAKTVSVDRAMLETQDLRPVFDLRIRLEEEVTVVRLAQTLDDADYLESSNFDSPRSEIEAYYTFDELQNFTEHISEHSAGLLECVDRTYCGAKVLSDCRCDWLGDRSKTYPRNPKVKKITSGQFLHGSGYPELQHNLGVCRNTAKSKSPSSPTAQVLSHFDRIHVEFVHRSAFDFISENSVMRGLLSSHGTLPYHDPEHESWAACRYRICRANLLECLEIIDAAQTPWPRDVESLGQKNAFLYFMKAWCSFASLFRMCCTCKEKRKNSLDRSAFSFTNAANLLHVLEPLKQRVVTSFTAIGSPFPMLVPGQTDRDTRCLRTLNLGLDDAAAFTIAIQQARKLPELLRSINTTSFKMDSMAWYTYSSLLSGDREDLVRLSRCIRETLCQGMSLMSLLRHALESNDASERHVLKCGIWFNILPFLLEYSLESSSDKQRQVLNECCKFVALAPTSLIDTVFELGCPITSFTELRAQLSCSVFFAVKHIYSVRKILDQRILDSFVRRGCASYASVVLKSKRPHMGEDIVKRKAPDQDLLQTYVCRVLTSKDYFVDPVTMKCWEIYDEDEAFELSWAIWDQHGARPSTELVVPVNEFWQSPRGRETKRLWEEADEAHLANLLSI